MSSNIFNVLINWHASYFFKPSKGLRKGFSLSPYLLCWWKKDLVGSLRCPKDKGKFQKFMWGGVND
jgi:hypothetical protein